MKYAMFFLAEYINMATVSAMATTLFLGGWQNTLADLDLGRRELRLLAGAVVRRQDDVCFIFFYIWLRGTLPRLLRPVHEAGLEDLIPVSLGWILLVATVRAVGRETTFSRTTPAGGRCRGPADRGDHHVHPAEAQA